MGKPTEEELNQALEEVSRMREHGDDPHFVAKYMLNIYVICIRARERKSIHYWLRPLMNTTPKKSDQPAKMRIAIRTYLKINLFRFHFVIAFFKCGVA
jgi:hypothetical protein